MDVRYFEKIVCDVCRGAGRWHLFSCTPCWTPILCSQGPKGHVQCFYCNGTGRVDPPPPPPPLESPLESPE